LEAQFKAYPESRSEPVAIEEIDRAAQPLGVPLPADFREFVARYGGAEVGAFPLYGLRLAPNMERFGTFVEATSRFRTQGWPGTAEWVVISMDHSGNPVGLDRSGRVWISDHDRGSIEKLADDFEGYIRRWCLKLKL